MTKDDFHRLWTERYPRSVPLSYTFRTDYPDRWFRIHSLSASKRYPENEDEWATVLARQNSLITEVLGNGCKILLVTGTYIFREACEDLHPLEDVGSLTGLSFTLLDAIDLHGWWPQAHDKGEFFRPRFCASTWSAGKFDGLLRAVAQDVARVFFMAVDRARLVLPYDGGVDLILEDKATRDKYKSKYRAWLSKREDGL